MLPALLSMLGSAASSPLGQQAIAGLGSWGANKAYNWFNGPQGQPAQDPNVQAQQGYLQQIQQPINMGMGNRQQQLMNDFYQNILPGIQEQFAGAGGQRSSAFGQQLGQAGANLQTNLGALGEQNEFQNNQLNQQRLGQLGGYLGQQQGLGLQAQQLNQQGTIANREAQLRAMGLMQGANQSQQQLSLQQLLGRGNLQGQLAGLGLGNKFDTLRHGGSQSIGGQMLGAGLNAGLNYLGGR